jgi:hypothetical protein
LLPDFPFDCIQMKNQVLMWIQTSDLWLKKSKCQTSYC